VPEGGQCLASNSHPVGNRPPQVNSRRIQRNFFGLAERATEAGVADTNWIACKPIIPIIAIGDVKAARDERHR
jgi:hypothetical protein